MATKILNTLDSASEKMLKSAKKQLKEEAGKQLMKYKAMIPSKETIKQRLVDEIVKQGKELACSPEGQKFMEDLKKKIEDGLEVAKDFLKKAREKLQSIKEQIQKIRDFVDRMLGYLDIMEGLILTLSVAIRVAQIAIKVLKGPAADVDAGLKLKDLINKAKQQQEEFKGTIATFKFKISKTLQDILSPTRIVDIAINAISPLISAINGILALIATYFGQYLNVCGLNNNGEVDDLLDELDDDVADEVGDTNGIEYIDFLEKEDGTKTGYIRYKT